MKNSPSSRLTEADRQRTRNERSQRRFIAACAAMEGLLADPEDREAECLPGEPCHQAVARIAVAHADALLERLDAPPAP